LNQMEITCTFCITGTKPEDQGIVLGKRDPLEQLEEYADEENGDEENKSSDTSSEDDGSASDESQTPMNGLSNKFKLIKKSDDDIDLNFKDADLPEENEENQVLNGQVFDGNSKSMKCPAKSNQVNGSSMLEEPLPLQSKEASEKNSSTSTPLKNMDHNVEYFGIQANGNKFHQPEEAKLALQSELRPQTVSQPSLASEL
jgi:hypothetical protein